MRLLHRFRKIGVTALLLIIATGAGPLAAAQVREPVYAGRFYPAQRSALERTIARLVAAAGNTDRTGMAQPHLKALVVPHAGYIYSGSTAAHCTRELADRHFSKVIVMGPDHRVGIRSAAISAVRAYRTPLGRIDLHPDADRLRQGSDLFDYSPLSDRTEHSVEVVLPFLQAGLDEPFQLVPVVIGKGDPFKIAAGLETALDADTLLVASSDLSHYLPYRQAVAWDRATLELIKNLEPEKLMLRSNSACGRSPIAVILHLARQRHWQPVVLNYTNSGDTAGDRARVVGYAAVAFYSNSKTRGRRPMGTCDKKEQGNILLDHARQTIAEKLGREVDPEACADLEQKLEDSCFDTKSGTFVTLTLKGQLRGCIGNMTSTVNLRDGVRQNAISAAFHDPRFSPLTAAELEQVHIEISILTEPQPLNHDGGEDLVRKLRPDIDGVIISKGLHRATFLPQVWKQLPRTDDFLSRLCLKAGLPANTWQSEVLDVQTYQVISFEEEP
jgi:AmmeMemoRadiSam system protein B/AmmeMemoRadiSam system protein A